MLMLRAEKKIHTQRKLFIVSAIAECNITVFKFHVQVQLKTRLHCIIIADITSVNVSYM